MGKSMERPVFVSYAHEDIDRVRNLVEALTREGLDVFWDEKIGGGQRWRVVIPYLIDKAAAVVALWTKTSVQSTYVCEEAELGKERKILVPVMFEGNVKIPFGFREIQCVDLAGWAGGKSSKFDQLMEALHGLVERTVRGPYHEQPVWGDYTFGPAQGATSELQRLSGTIQELGDVLLVNHLAVDNVNAALDEVGKTYRAVRKAIDAFLSPAVESGPINGKLYIRMESGSLESTIKNGRGHCTNIHGLYRGPQGLRDAVEGLVDAKRLEEIDRAFDLLGTADGDLFRHLSEIGFTLTKEAEVIADMLIEGRTEAARDRIRDDRRTLQPVRKKLTAAIDELQDAQQKLGYAGPSDE